MALQLTLPSLDFYSAHDLLLLFSACLNERYEFPSALPAFYEMQTFLLLFESINCDLIHSRHIVMLIDTEHISFTIMATAIYSVDLSSLSLSKFALRNKIAIVKKDECRNLEKERHSAFFINFSAEKALFLFIWSFWKQMWGLYWSVKFFITSLTFLEIQIAVWGIYCREPAP